MDGQPLAKANFIAHGRKHIIQLAYCNRDASFFFVGMQNISDTAASHYNSEIGQQGNPRIVSDKNKNLAMLAQQFQGACAVDACIFDFIQQDNGRITDDGSVGDK